MKSWRIILKHILIIFKINFFILILSQKALSQEIKIEFKGNNFTDEIAISSLLKNKPLDISEDYSNYIIKTCFQLLSDTLICLIP